jgi:flagellar basal body-associated protein FliL
MKAKNILWTIIAAVALICLAGSLTSCNSVKKFKTKSHEKTDSTGVKKVDSTGVVKYDSSSTNKKDSSHTETETTGTETEVEVDFSGEEDSTGTTVVIGADTIKTTGKKPVKIKWKGKTTNTKTDSSGISTTDITVVSSGDSSTVAKSDSSHATTDVKTVDLYKKSSRVSVWIIIGILVFVCACAGLWWFFGPPRKKRQSSA